MAREGFEPSASLVLSESGLPVAYRAASNSGGWNRTSASRSRAWRRDQPRPPRNPAAADLRFGEEDSNLHHRIQSPGACRWPIPQSAPRESNPPVRPGEPAPDRSARDATAILVLAAPGEGVEPPRPRGRLINSEVRLPFRHPGSSADAGRESARRGSNPHFRHGQAAGSRYITGASIASSNRIVCIRRLRIVKERTESAGRESNPRLRLTRAASVRPDPRRLKRLGPEGLEPSPAWLRARDAAANTLVPEG